MQIVELHNGNVSTPIHSSVEKLASGKITKGINTIDSFQFSMLPSNAGYGEIYDYTTLVTVYNTNRNRYEFYGRVLYSEDTMSDNGLIQKEVICENFFGFLCDSQQDYVEERNWTVGGLLQHIINKHNSQVEGYKQFTIGEVTVTDPNDNVYCGIQRENTWETLKKKLIDVLGGELRFRVDGDVIYLDYLTQIGEVSNTEIALSKNMKSISREKDPSEIVTRLIPLGGKLNAVDDEGKEVETEYRLDISSVNDGKKYVDDDRAIAIYGIRVATVEFDDVTVASTLLKRGEDWLKSNNRILVKYTITALDLSLIGKDVDDFEVGNFYPVKNPLMGIDDTARIIKKSIDICEEVKSTLDFGDNFETLTEAMKRKSDALGLITRNYVTNKRFANYATRTSSLIEQTEERIKLEVAADYSDLSARVSQIEIDVDGINIQTSKIDELSTKVAQIEVEVDSINIQTSKIDEHSTEIAQINIEIGNINSEVSKKVGNDEIGTKIQQNYNSVQIAWNNISQYISFEDGKLNIKNDDGLLSSMGRDGTWYYYGGNAVGTVGTNSWEEDSTYRGVSFDIENGSGYMCWAHRENADDAHYTVKLIYHADDTKEKKGLHFKEEVYNDGTFWLTPNVCSIMFEDGSSGLYSENNEAMLCGQGAMIGCGITFTIYHSDNPVDCYNDIDMKGYSLLNTSDARYKTNIRPTETNALNLINSIELKQFDWIESGEHCDLGMIAQQVQEIAPHLVNETKSTGKLSIKVDKFIPYLIKAVQELSDNNNGGEKHHKGWEDKYNAKEKESYISAYSEKKKKQKTETKPKPLHIPIHKKKEKQK